MSLHEPSPSPGDPGDQEVNDSEGVDAHFVFRVAARTFAVLVALLVFLPLWLYLSSVVELMLDYPIRRAGESDVYPTRGTHAFWWNCLVHTSKGAFFAYLFGGIPLIMTICFFFYYGLSIRNWAARLIIALVIACAPFIHGYLHIRFYGSWHKFDDLRFVLEKRLLLDR